jgi:tetratricopeptide (TPR) repeat protein
MVVTMNLRLIAVFAFLSLIVISGCNDVTKSELDTALDPIRELPEVEQESALRIFISDNPMLAHYGLWELGNIMYDKANAIKAENKDMINPACKALLDSALVFYDLAAASDTMFVHAYANAGLIWDELGEEQSSEARDAMTQAEKYYLKAIEIDSTEINARVNLGALLFKKKDFTGAITQYQDALDIDSKCAIAHYKLGIMFAETKIYREAIIEWELAAKYDSDGAVGKNSLENIQVIHDLLNSDTPDELKKKKFGNKMSKVDDPKSTHQH